MVEAVIKQAPQRVAVMNAMTRTGYEAHQTANAALPGIFGQGDGADKDTSATLNRVRMGLGSILTAAATKPAPVVSATPTPTPASPTPTPPARRAPKLIPGGSAPH